MPKTHPLTNSSLATALSIRYRSWMALHEQVTWVAEGSHSPSLRLPVYHSQALHRLADAVFNQRLVPLKCGRFYPARL
ncbi:MAG: hypothetical protein ACFCVA_02225 [Gammaproteobacteria bacterium]